MLIPGSRITAMSVLFTTLQTSYVCETFTLKHFFNQFHNTNMSLGPSISYLINQFITIEVMSKNLKFQNPKSKIFN